MEEKKVTPFTEKYGYLLGIGGLLSVFLLGTKVVLTAVTGYASFKYNFQRLQNLFLFMVSWLLFGFWYSVLSTCFTALHVLVYKREVLKGLLEECKDTETYTKSYEKFDELKNNLVNTVSNDNVYYNKLASVYEDNGEYLGLVSVYLERLNGLIGYLMEYIYKSLEKLPFYHDLMESYIPEKQDKHVSFSLEEDTKRSTKEENEKLDDLKELLKSNVNSEDLQAFDFDPTKAAGLFKGLSDLSNLPIPPNTPDELAQMPMNMPMPSKEQIMKEVQEFKNMMSELEGVANLNMNNKKTE